jgi:predicted nucleic acid-binding protein
VISALDTNLLLDILLPDPSHVEPSKRLLDHARMRSALVISEVVYAELSAHFPSKGDLDRFLREVSITLTPSTPEALYEAAQAWRRYLRRRPQGLQCPQCGSAQVIRCGRCGRRIPSRQHILSDFLIGGHALALAQTLLTRDRSYYRTYFPRLRLNKISV